MTHEQTTSGTDRERLLRKLRERYETLDTRSRKQRALIDEGRIDELLGVLRDRQSIIEEIESLSKRVNAIAEGALPAHERQVFRAELAAIEGLAHAISARDEADRAELDARRGKVSQELAGLGTQRAAVKAYSGGDAARGRARFQDGRA